MVELAQVDARMVRNMQLPITIYLDVGIDESTQLRRVRGAVSPLQMIFTATGAPVNSSPVSTR